MFYSSGVFESAIFRFLWIGKLEKLKLDELKNSASAGGLNLPCVLSKADSLFLSQTCRLLTIPESRQYKHIKYWLGLYVKEYFPDMAQGPHSEIISTYFMHMKSLLLEGLVVGDIIATNLKKTTSKALYAGFTFTTLNGKKFGSNFSHHCWSQEPGRSSSY